MRRAPAQSTWGKAPLRAKRGVGSWDAGQVSVFHGGSSGLATSVTTTIVGSSVESIGGSVAGAGDVNGDGYADVIAGAQRYGGYYAGQAYVFHGSAAGVSSTASATLTSSTRWSYFGQVVAGVGDLDGDGYDDVAVGAWGYDDDRGSSSVYRGSASGTVTTAAATWIGTEDEEMLGQALSGAGDVNGDGYADLLLGSYGVNSARLYLGGASGAASTATTTLAGVADDEALGYALAGVGDVNLDGYDDVLVGAPGSGSAYTFHGSATGLPTTASTVTTIHGDYDDIGSAVASAGDVNGDGYPDAIVGGLGGADVYLGSASGLAGSPSTMLSIGGSPSTRFGTAVDGAGDVNGDGYDDVVVGAYGDDTAYLYAGSAGGVSSTAAWTYVGTSHTNLGRAVVGLGDVNGDGYDDVGVADPAYAGNSGRILVFHGSSAGLSTSPDAMLDGTAGVALGWSLSAADLDGDGYGDLVAGAHLYAGSTGRFYVFSGSPTGLDGARYAIVDGTTSSSGFGTSVDAGGDVDGDRYPDLVVGAPLENGNFGAAYLFTGSVAGFTSTPESSVYGTAYPEQLGYDVAIVGDVDADGYDDVVVGSYRSDEGRVTGFYGGNDADGDGYDATTDCDDTNPAISPGAQEVCDAADTDEDCDGSADDASAEASSMTDAWVDADGDGYGSGTAVAMCDVAAGYAAVDEDCDDADAAISPAATEVCDPYDTDEDCDGLADDADASVDTSTMTEVWVDADGDGYGAGSAVAMCDLAAGYATVDEDCDDADATINPAAADATGDEIDADCDGAELCGVDADGDGYRPIGDSGVASADLDCDDAGEALASAPATDCDDTSADWHPGATEDCADPSDYNCDGSSGYADVDGDGWAACAECDDATGAVNPDAEEVCNGLDDDCDTVVDGSSATDAVEWYADADGDGYTDLDTWMLECDEPEGYAEPTDDDCDDTDPDVSPGAEEVAGDGIDQDCDGSDPEAPTSEPAEECGCSPGAPVSLAWVVPFVFVWRRLRSTAPRPGLPSILDRREAAPPTPTGRDR